MPARTLRLLSGVPLIWGWHSTDPRRRPREHIFGACDNGDMSSHVERLPPRDVLRARRTAILSLLAERGGRDVRLFGSLARGDEDDQSDIDLLVELPDVDSAAAELLAALGLSEELSQLVGTRVEVVTPGTLREEVRDAALAEAVPL